MKCRSCEEEAKVLEDKAPYCVKCYRVEILKEKNGNKDYRESKKVYGKTSKRRV